MIQRLQANYFLKHFTNINLLKEFIVIQVTYEKQKSVEIMTSFTFDLNIPTELPLVIVLRNRNKIKLLFCEVFLRRNWTHSDMTETRQATMNVIGIFFTYICKSPICLEQAKYSTQPLKTKYEDKLTATGIL